jgi:hypothetical protein
MRQDQRAEATLSDGRVTVTGNCFVTGNEHSVNVPLAGFKKWESGMMIQAAMPGVSAEDREFLISGTSPAGWRQLFGQEE